ncbi:MAG: hypothetical protein IPH94_17565 [Saprospiraceae bacterium]|nr:hypothetical protein [Saprospiraceae bacterium]MBK7789391.1 hypothetical protein [Saprospiraceae bacterium]MBK8112786.1 hypothetical protein [Saprospiraceae bacterium]MBK8852347.1 hypothetical protein [Saprospiraceae bacterium]MBK9688008.1 hypothetical protein [Saprospiraceae bacterium]
MWRKLNGDPLKLTIEEETEAVILRERDMGNRLKVCIGSDSQVRGGHIEFATVVVFLREGKGGFMFIQNEQFQGHMGIKERMITEVSKSVATAYALCNILDKYGVELEVHADINTDPTFKSNVALREAMGYIMGMGYTFKAKPDAFASSSCADKVIN